MSFQILINFILAFLWMFLQNKYSFSSFLIGYLLGMFIMLAFRPFLKERFYLGRVYSVFKLIAIFIRELILSNLSVLKVIFKPSLDMQPGIFALETVLTKDWEITILANMITLTPGTLVIDISEDNKILYIHAMDVPDVDEAVESIRNSFEKVIKEVSS